MQIITHREQGLFPKPAQIEMSCSCPDWATMCKHVAAAMDGVGVPAKAKGKRRGRSPARAKR